jgi:hypothetical protein
MDESVTFFQIIDRANNESYPPFSIIINVMKDRIKIYDYDMPMDDNWHLLMVQFDYKKPKFGSSKSSHKIRLYIDSLLKSINADTRPNHPFHKNHDHIFAYGCDAVDVLGGQKALPALASNQISM